MKVSIITVCYNSEQHIKSCIDSVLGQNYPNIEYIIVDGKSKDKTVEIIQSYQDKITKWVSEPDKGIYDAMNKGIKMATGDIVGILNSDDIYLDSDVIANVAKAFADNQDCGVVYGDIIYFRTENPDKIVRYWKTKTYYPNFFPDGEVPPHPAVFVRKSVYDQNGLYFPEFKISSDYEWMLRTIYANKVKPYYIGKTLVNMRMEGESTKSWKNTLIANKEIHKAWGMNGLSYPFKLYFLRPFKKIKQLFVSKQ